MNKRISILGIQIDNYSIDEAVAQVEVYLNSTGVNTIEAITTETLVQAQENEGVRNCIEQLDLSIIGERELLKAAGVKTADRIKEISDNAFLAAFLQLVVQNEKKIYLLGGTREQTTSFLDYLMTINKQLNIIGSYALEECVGDFDGAINEINIATPDIVVSVLPSPLQEHFISENKGKLNAQIWYGLGEGYITTGSVDQMKKAAKRIIQKGKLRSMLSKYNKES
jgi:N-acetylglucosaminyldiphosphoundecaprenol N-acetyl-beta-D-mannosaminyltransferase